MTDEQLLMYPEYARAIKLLHGEADIEQPRTDAEERLVRRVARALYGEHLRGRMAESEANEIRLGRKDDLTDALGLPIDTGWRDAIARLRERLAVASPPSPG